MFQQILYYINSVIALPFLPILSYLGKKVEKEIPKLPEASENITGQITGNREAINLLTIGESTIAGVGVTDHKDGITGQIALFLQKKTQKIIISDHETEQRPSTTHKYNKTTRTLETAQTHK